MKYALNLGEEGRILSVTYPEFAPEDAAVVDALPDGDISEYRHVNGAFIHDPLPKPEQPKPEPTADDILNVLLGVTE